MRKNIILFIIVVTVTIFAFANTAFSSPEKKIKIGVIGPLKFTPGKVTWYGAQMAAGEINAAGGVIVKGVRHKIELVKKDTNETLSVPDALGAMERLITIDKVNFVTGGYRTEAVLAIQDLVADYKMIYIGGAGAPVLTERVSKNYDKYKYYFRAIHCNVKSITTGGFLFLESIVKTVREKLGIKKPKVAILMDKVKVGDVMAKVATSLTPKMGAEVAGVWRPSTFSTDLTPELTAIKSAGAHIIYTFATGPSAVFYSKQWGELQIPAALVGVNVEAQRKAHWKISNGKCEYSTIHTLFGPAEITPKSKPFWDTYSSRFNEYPAFQSGTYDSIYILKAAIERAGTLETEPMIAALEKTDHLGAQGRMVFYPKGHKWTHGTMWGPKHIPSVALQWRDGKLVSVWPNGKAALGDKRWVGVRFKGTEDYQLPPWMLRYWKDR